MLHFIFKTLRHFLSKKNFFDFLKILKWLNPLRGMHKYNKCNRIVFNLFVRVTTSKILK